MALPSYVTCKNVVPSADAKKSILTVMLRALRDEIMAQNMFSTTKIGGNLFYCALEPKPDSQARDLTPRHMGLVKTKDWSLEFEVLVHPKRQSMDLCLDEKVFLTGSPEAYYRDMLLVKLFEGEDGP